MLTILFGQCTVEPVFSGPRDHLLCTDSFPMSRSFFNGNVPEMGGHLVDADTVIDIL